MNELFSNQEQKTYWCIVKTNLKSEDKLVHYLKKKEKQYFKAHLKEVPESKIASLDYKNHQRAQ
jgi:23S rRNA pseudouridine1911/1915/1917 synthase